MAAKPHPKSACQLQRLLGSAAEALTFRLSLTIKSFFAKETDSDTALVLKQRPCQFTIVSIVDLTICCVECGNVYSERVVREACSVERESFAISPSEAGRASEESPYKREDY